MDSFARATRLQMFNIVIGSLIALIGAKANAGVSKSIPQIGLHNPLLNFEKNENRQNLMVVFTRLVPATCEFDAKAGVAVLDYYWLMNGTDYKPVNPVILQSVRERLEVDTAAFKSSKKFLVHLKEFKELKSDLGMSPTFEVKSKKIGTACDATVEMQLGPSDKNRRVKIDSIYAESTKTILPPFRKLQALTINGKDLKSGDVVHRTYTAN